MFLKEKQKKCLVEKKFYAFWTLETDISRSRNHSRIDENPVICHIASILLLPWSSRVAPRCENCVPMCSRDAKMASQGAPEVPKWFPNVLPGCKNRVPKCQKEGTELSKWHPRQKIKHGMLKWMLGCSGGVKIVFRNAEIKDSSKIKFFKVLNR